jgi:hypothetical protein
MSEAIVEIQLSAECRQLQDQTISLARSMPSADTRDKRSKVARFLPSPLLTQTGRQGHKGRLQPPNRATISHPPHP